MKTILTAEDLKRVRPMAKDIDNERLLTYVNEAQLFDLRQLLGTPLYVAFLANFDNSGDTNYTLYQNLLLGCSYTFGSVTYDHMGVAVYLSYCSLARFYSSHNIHVTKMSIVNKKVDQSDTISTGDLEKEISTLRSLAIACQPDIERYLRTINFPLYNYRTGNPDSNNAGGFFDPQSSGVNDFNGRTNYNL